MYKNLNSAQTIDYGASSLQVFLKTLHQISGALTGFGGQGANGLGGLIHPPKHNIDIPIWVSPKIGVPQNGWFIMENPIEMDDLGLPPFKETSI